MRYSQEKTIPKASTIKYGGFWIRLVAAAIDILVWYLVALLCSVAVGFLATFLVDVILSDDNLELVLGGRPSVRYLATAVIVAVVVGYNVIVPVVYGATPGKILLGYRIVDENGYRMSYLQSFLRYTASLLSAMPLAAGYIWIGFDNRKQGWHDKIARTYVVRRDSVKSEAV